MSRSQLLLRFNVPHHFFSSSSPSTAPNDRRAQPKVLRFSLKESRNTLFPHTQLLLRTAKHPFPSHTTSPTNRETSKNLWFSLTQILVVVALHPSQWPSSATKVLAFSLQPSTKHLKVPLLIFKYQARTIFVCFAKI